MYKWPTIGVRSRSAMYFAILASCNTYVATYVVSIPPGSSLAASSHDDRIDCESGSSGFWGFLIMPQGHHFASVVSSISVKQNVWSFWGYIEQNPLEILSQNLQYMWYIYSMSTCYIHTHAYTLVNVAVCMYVLMHLYVICVSLHRSVCTCMYVCIDDNCTPQMCT